MEDNGGGVVVNRAHLRPTRPPVRVLAIDPTSRGFGFVVLEGLDTLVDWGVREVRRDKAAVTLRKVGEIIERYQPNVLIVEDCAHPSSRRRARARSLVDAVAALAYEMSLRVRCLSPATIRGALGTSGAGTKHDITTLLAQRFPELARSLPPRRKPWMSEHHAQAVFDAAALALAYVSRDTKRPTVVSISVVGRE